MAAAGMAARFFEWLSIAHPHNNVHNMRLCRLVADARVLPPAALAQLQAVDRVRCLPCSGPWRGSMHVLAGGLRCVVTRVLFPPTAPHKF
jgi:hypothetical protein